MVNIIDKVVSLEEACLAGIRYYQERKLSDAIEVFSRVIEVDPLYPRALNALAIITSDGGDNVRALSYLDTLLTAHPGFDKGYNTLGTIFLRQGKFAEAEESFFKAIALNPSLVEAHGSLGDMYLLQEKWEEAGNCFRRVIELSPGSFPAHYGEGIARSKTNHDREAVESLREALRIKPDFVDAYVALIRPLQNLGKLRDAATACETALKLRPDSPLLYNALGNLRLIQGFPEEAIKQYRQALKYNPRCFTDHSNIIMTMHYTGTYSPTEILAESRLWEQQHSLERFAAHASSENPRIRIGYVSSDFRHHVVSYFFEPLLASHDRKRFQIYCYADVGVPDGKTRQLSEMADCWVDIAGMPDKAVAERVMVDNIDILVDLAGHTANHRLRVFSMKPAPVQVTWLGYPGTTGLSAMDYRISDGIADPQGVTDSFHTETVVRLPEAFLCYLPPSDSPDVSPLPAHGLGAVTFGSFNNLAKLTPAVLATWGKILRQVPNSRLLLKNKWFSDEATCSRFFELLEAEGIDRSRIQLLTYARNNWHHLARYWKMDISLDTFPYNGTTTSFESLWMGVPLITLAGDHHAGRVGASILSCLGLDELVAKSIDGYIDKAVKLAHDPQYVYHLRQTLRQRLADSALCDAAGFSRRLEEAYLAMLEKIT